MLKIHWRALPAWALRAWPALGLLPLFGIHYWAIAHFTSQTVLVHKLASSVSQIVGGLLIVYSIDQNLGLFRNQSVLSSITAWVRQFPIVKNIVAHVATGSISVAGSSVAGFVGRTAPTSLEERVAELEHAIEGMRKQFKSDVNRLDTRISSTHNDLSGRIDLTSTRIEGLSRTLEEAAVGGTKLQAFGVLLAIYGAITSVFA